MVIVETRDVDEARATCGEVYFPHRLRVLHDTRDFRMSLTAIAAGPIAAGLLSYADEVVIETGELTTGYQVNVPLDGALNTRSGSDELCATMTTAAVYRPDAHAQLHGWKGGGRLFGLKIDRSALEDHLSLMLDRPVRSPVALSPRLDLTTTRGRRWWSLARTLVELAHDPAASHPLVVRPLTQAVVSALLMCTDHPDRDALAEPAPQVGPRAIRRAVELVEAHPERGWTSADLAREAGLSVRALQEGFARHLGSTPMSHIRSVRLTRAHGDLLLSDPGAQSVAGIATRWGFSHFGRFAAAHREHYGEAPSLTLHRRV
jgi:AraC-like DNA-binding protein